MTGRPLRAGAGARAELRSFALAITIAAMDQESGYRGVSKGTGCGSAAAFALALPAGTVVFIAVTMSECMPGESCHENDGLGLLARMAIVLGLAAVFGASVRALINWFLSRSDDGAAAGRPPVIAAIAAFFLLILTMFLWWLGLVLAV